ncbi:MAG: hypothetical protein BGO01_16535 [Armatimonadetes bacterium 55-13]|nr:MAG: hypothetical protein BGO01_16535 [Armatimonadetes bacterium 55-13]
MTLRPLGMQAMQEKLAEFRRSNGLEPESFAPAFQQQMNAANGQSGLSGQISPGGTKNEFAPFNPFGSGAQVQPSIAPAQLKALIDKAANDNNVDPALLDALVAAESDYNPSAISSKRAAGLTQLMPDTARSLGVTNPLDPAQSLQGGAKYLSMMITRFDGDLEKALAAYNAGPGAVEKAGGVPNYEETKNYVRRILERYRGVRP